MARSAAAAVQPAVTYSEIDLSGDFALSSPARRVKAKTISLPGDVHTALLAAGDIPDPYFGANEQAVMWVHATPWSVERRFTAGRDQIEISAHRGPCAGYHRRHPHVLGTAERHRRAQHRQPQEQDRRQFVRPDQRLAQSVARHHAGKQDHDLGNDQDRRWDLHQKPQQGFDRGRQGRPARGLYRHLADRDAGHFDVSHDRPPRL